MKNNFDVEINKILSNIRSKQNRSNTETMALQQMVMDISSTDITIFNICSVVKKIKVIIPLLINFIALTVETQASLQATYIDLLNIQARFQEQLQILNKRIEE